MLTSCLILRFLLNLIKHQSLLFEEEEQEEEKHHGSVHTAGLRVIVVDRTICILRLNTSSDKTRQMSVHSLRL